MKDEVERGPLDMIDIAKEISILLQKIEDISKKERTKFNPQIGQYFWIVCPQEIGEEDIVRLPHFGDAGSYAFVASGNCFKTEEEAYENVEKIREEQGMIGEY